MPSQRILDDTNDLFRLWCNHSLQGCRIGWLVLAEKSEEPSLGLLSFRLVVSRYEPIVCAHDARRYLAVPSQIRDFPLVVTDISTHWVTQKHWNRTGGWSGSVSVGKSAILARR